MGKRSRNVRTFQSLLVIQAKPEKHYKRHWILSASLKPDDVWLCHATPYPGTHLREIVVKNGWPMSQDWKTYNTMNPIFEDPNLPAKEIAEMRRQFYNKFYSPSLHPTTSQQRLPQRQPVQQNHDPNRHKLQPLASHVRLPPLNSESLPHFC